MNEKAQQLVFEFYNSVGEYIKTEYNSRWFRYYNNKELFASIIESIKLYYFGGNTVPFAAGQIIESLKKIYGNPKRKNI